MDVSKCRKLPFHSYVSKEVIFPGTRSVEKPIEGAKCDVVLRKIYMSESVDCSYSEYLNQLNRSPLNLLIIIGEADCELDRGLEYALTRMRPGEESNVLLRDTTSSEDIASFKDFIVSVKLNNFVNPSPIFERPDVTKLLRAEQHKEKGNRLYNAHRLIDAFHRFSKAVKLCITITDDCCANETKQVYVMLCNNMAVCQLQFKNYEFALDLCNKVLEKSPDNKKGLMRRTEAYINLRDFDKAFEDVNKLLKIDPKNIYGIKSYIKIKENLEVQHGKYSDMIKQMFKTE